MSGKSKEQRIAEFVPFAKAKRDFETQYVEVALKLADGNVSMAARLARKDRKDFYAVMSRCGVTPKDYR